MPNTFGELKAEVLDWLDETVPESRTRNAINDAIESLWETLIRAAIGLFVGGPTSLSVAAAAERTTVTSVTDPTTAPTLSDVAVGNLAEHAIVVAYTLVTESGTETLISSTSSRTVPINNICSVASPSFVESAVGWNCYMGSPTGRLAKQNEVPILFGNAFQEPVTGFVNEPENPSPPTENTTGDDIFYIRHLEVSLTSGGYKKWDGADIDSLLMQRAARGIASQSQYQSYYWDLINQRQLEMRPAAGQAMTPRYFYIKRPRRIRFDSAPLPFLTVPSTAFLRYHALSVLFLSIHEYEASTAWSEKAERERARCELAVLAMNRPKNQYITPCV